MRPDGSWFTDPVRPCPHPSRDLAVPVDTKCKITRGVGLYLRVRHCESLLEKKVTTYQLQSPYEHQHFTRQNARIYS